MTMDNLKSHNLEKGKAFREQITEDTYGECYIDFPNEESVLIDGYLTLDQLRNLVKTMESFLGEKLKI